MTVVVPVKVFVPVSVREEVALSCVSAVTFVEMTPLMVAPVAPVPELVIEPVGLIEALLRTSPAEAMEELLARVRFPVFEKAPLIVMEPWIPLFVAPVALLMIDSLLLPVTAPLKVVEPVVSVVLLPINKDPADTSVMGLLKLSVAVV